MEYHLNYHCDGLIEGSRTSNMFSRLDYSKVRKYIDSLPSIDYYEYRIDGHKYRDYDGNILEIFDTCYKLTDKISIDNYYYQLLERNLSASDTTSDQLIGIYNVKKVREHVTDDNLTIKISYDYVKHARGIHVYRIIDGMDYYHYLYNDVELLQSLE